jgi:transposase, IS30 family
MSYQHLSREERYQISALLKEGLTQSQIAHNLGRHKSTISRELTRNRGLRGYRPKQADQLATNRSHGSRNARRVSAHTWATAVKQLRRKFSPEQVAALVDVSHETIYRHIYADKASGGDLWRHLRCQKKRRKRYGAGRDRRGQIVGRRPISARPVHVDARRQVGHWEGDTVIGVRHQQAIVSLVERKTGYAILAKVKRKTSELVSGAIIRRLRSMQPLVKTITYDNGKEFAEHARVDKALGSTGYFADPFSSWQRGSNENLNGLIRQYIPKKRALSSVTETELALIEEELNNRPRKRLGFRTPHELFTEELHRVALRT